LRHPAVSGRRRSSGCPMRGGASAARVRRPAAGVTTADRLRQFARDRLAHFKAPHTVTFVNELPKRRREDTSMLRGGRASRGSRVRLKARAEGKSRGRKEKVKDGRRRAKTTAPFMNERPASRRRIGNSAVRRSDSARRTGVRRWREAAVNAVIGRPTTASVYRVAASQRDQRHRNHETQSSPPRADAGGGAARSARPRLTATCAGSTAVLRHFAAIIRYATATRGR
jgi:hypothetical protein